MRIKKYFAATATAIALSSIALAAINKPAVPLLTADQREIDTTALSLLDEPAVRQARSAAFERWKKLRANELPDGKSQLEGAIDEAVFITLRAVAANDPANPKVFWTVAPPYFEGKHKIPGSRLGGDNPDRIYRGVAVDPAYRYQISGQRNVQPSLDEFTFEVWPLPLVIGKPQLALSSRDIDIAKDGSFTITADSTPTNGRRNHLYLAPGTATIFSATHWLSGRHNCRMH